jgi:N utilization substance protein B
MGARRRGRELALQALYQADLSGDEPGGAVEEFWRHCDAAPEACAFGRELAAGVLAERRRIDALIAESSEHWRLGRLPHVDLNILRVATWELLCRSDVPRSIVIDEAVEIAKRFGGADSATFVNGVLDHIADVLAGERERGAR